jgi:transposase
MNLENIYNFMTGGFFMFQHPKMRYIYCGIDVHKRTHTACFINCFFERLGEITFENKKADFKKLLTEAKKYTPKGMDTCFGLEDVNGNGRELAVFLIEKKFMVKYVNPSFTHAERKSAATYQKSDSIDSFCVAKALLSKFDTLHDAQPSDLHWILADLVGKRRLLVKHSTATKNQLHVYLGHNYTNYRRFFSGFDGKAALSFWERYPSPSTIKDTTIENLTEFLWEKSHHFYTINKAVEIMDYIEKDGYEDLPFQEEKDSIISLTVKQLKANQELISGIEEEIKKVLPKFGYKLESMYGLGAINAAELVAEIGDINRFPNADTLACYSGISPIRYSSGQTDKHFSNKMGNKNLRQTLFNISITLLTDPHKKGIPKNQYFFDYYNKKISEGKTTKQALRCIMRKLVNIIYKMMRDKSEYREPPRKSPEENLANNVGKKKNKK